MEPAERSGEGADALVLGGDIGGSSTRIVIADRAGRVVSRGSAGGGNPVSRPDTAVEAFRTALTAAVAGVDASRVRAAVVGLAGGSTVGGGVGSGFDAAWAAAGIGCPATYCSDVEVAFASGTPEPDGTVLVAGTGAVAGAVREGRVVRVADGHGWLLGDDGSGFWLGRAAVRSALRELESGRADRPGVLTRSVLAHHRIAAGPDARNALVAACHAGSPVDLAALAPVVLGLAADDPVAGGLVRSAADLLLDTLARVRPDPQQPLVLAGALLGPTPVGDRLRTGLVTDRGRGWPDRVEQATDGTRGAVRMALRTLDHT